MSSLSALQDYAYQLPEHLIAKHPLSVRSASKLMLLNPKQHLLHHHTFNELPQLCQPNDLLVFNDTQVVKARLYGQKPTGGQLEIFVEKVLSATRAKVMIRASKAPKVGSHILLASEQTAMVVEKDNEFYQLELGSANWWSIMETHGEVPLPPYLNREATKADIDRYQSVFASHPGAVAAPTASLHFDSTVLESLKQRGVQSAFVTLHVGAGTFLPLRAAQLDDNRLHLEHYEIPQELAAKIKHCKDQGGRVIGVGTTVVRTLESAALDNPTLTAGHYSTQLFIRPGFNFQITDAMITNFHLPESSLLMLVAAFAGLELTQHAYQTAIEHAYRFYSYGDAMFIAHQKP